MQSGDGERGMRHLIGSSANVEDGRLEAFDVYDHLFSLYINAMAFVLEDETRAGETFCQKQLKKLPALLLREIREIQERGTDGLPRKRAKLGGWRLVLF